MRYDSLSGTCVIDLTQYIAGPYATKLLSDVGAEVVKIEPPKGEGGRRTGPFPANGRDLDRGGLFAFLNTNKSGITLNLKHQRGRELMLRLLDGADLLIENFAPGTLARMGLAPSELLARFPRLSIVSISNFGQDGPLRDAPLDDLTLFARGGWTFPVGEPDSAPLTPPGSLIQYVAALYAVIAALQSLFARDMGLGHGQHADISILEAGVSTMIYESVAFQYSGALRVRAGKRFGVGPFMIVTLECRDGYAGLHCVTDKQFESLCELINRPDLVKDERFCTALQRMVNNDALLAIVEPFFLEHDRAWLYSEGQKLKIPMVPIPSVAEVLEWEQLKARRFFETIDDPVLGPIRVPGPPLRLSSHRGAPSRPAPRLGEHNREILGGRLGISDRELESMREGGII